MIYLDIRIGSKTVIPLYISVIDHPSDYLAMGMVTLTPGYPRKAVLSPFHAQLSLQSLLWRLQIYLS